MNVDERQKTKLDYLIEYLHALAQLKGSDGSIPLWANSKAGEVCELIDQELKRV